MCFYLGLGLEIRAKVLYNKSEYQKWSHWMLKWSKKYIKKSISQELDGISWSNKNYNEDFEETHFFTGLAAILDFYVSRGGHFYFERKIAFKQNGPAIWFI